ncbi:glyoxylase-like metal-dependent hydrolase (beta-lactamase superfamily II) [Tumebacillus sp. BK434]|uniref:MBL fold metallo-hydrolase n=1 Tax=Tumebacillus sp. BK434 TaxID=2512169 RepID=UPI001048F389|nr:MBL fold metallo-hydrolase [Tumebacillus sp. BK434]TCP59297.1 glyoxylase-like metal-dependent hydrolase (beta-lactamase superfamily II) [Tumebacillus sp. BK434]
MAVQPLSAAELQRWIEQKDPQAMLLDVRSEREYAEWRIQTDALPSLNIPLAQFEDEHQEAWRDVPADRKIAVICRRGRTAMIVAKLLDEKGYDVYCLNQGLQEWSQFYHDVTVAEGDGWKLLQLIRMGKGCLSYLLVSGGEALVCDPGRHVEAYLQLADREGAAIRYVVDTHLHADHISGAPELARAAGAAYLISAVEMEGAKLAYLPLEEHEVIRVGGVQVQVLRVPTPGHTPGSTSFLIADRYLFSGDTVFVGGLGRPDLGGKAREWAQQLYETVFGTIAKLADDVLVLPAHFSDLTRESCAAGYVGAPLQEIRANNFLLSTADRAQFTELTAGRVDAVPPNYEEIVQVNRGLLTVDADKRLELETGPNRCAVKHTI